MQTMALVIDVTRTPITLDITTDQASLYNAFTEAGSPSAPCDVVVNISQGVVLKAGFDTGTWHEGSTFRINKTESYPGAADGAIIAGTGGAAGAGSSFNSLPGADGSSGGDAIVIHLDVSIANTGGFVLGGGGGGGGGGESDNGTDGGCGGGGGGGRGYNNAAGGLKGDNGNPLSRIVPGNDGNAGSSAGAGTAGAGGSHFGVNGGDGGAGGSWGQAGSYGNNGNGTNGKPGGAGGAAGRAVRTNGHTVTWLGGNDATHVKGAVA
jgi:hypothetical protein